MLGGKVNHKPIENARDADLRCSEIALKRAGLRAREIARRTGTAIVINRNGVIEHVKPEANEPMTTKALIDLALKQPPAERLGVIKVLLQSLERPDAEFNHI